MAAFIGAAELVSLISRTDAKKNMKVQILGTTQLALGVDPTNPTHIIDLSTEQVAIVHSSKLSSEQAVVFGPQSSSSGGERASGDYWFELRGERFNFRSLKALLGGAMLKLEEVAPGTLEKLSHIQPRSKRIVARDPNLLFRKPILVKKYAVPLSKGWWYGTNNSNAETETWLQRASECAGMEWSKDFRLSIG